MPPELVSLDYAPGSVFPSHVICKPVGKRRYAAWLGDQFLGHAIARVDGMWTSKTPQDETFPGRLDREAALLSLLALHRASHGEQPSAPERGLLYGLEKLRGALKNSVVDAVRPVRRKRPGGLLVEESA